MTFLFEELFLPFDIPQSPGQIVGARGYMHSHGMELNSVYYVLVALQFDGILLEFVVRVQTPQLDVRVGRSCCHIRSIRSDLPHHWVESDVNDAIFVAN